VFTLEPGIYIPEEKLGVRIEDILYVDQDGKLVNLTSNLPHTAEDVERTMAGSSRANYVAPPSPAPVVGPPHESRCPATSGARSTSF
jgi:hypothetical protein